MTSGSFMPRWTIWLLAAPGPPHVGRNICVATRDMTRTFSVAKPDGGVTDRISSRVARSR
jgi:hypothetical protein